MSVKIRSYLKKVFWPNLYVGPSIQLLEILEYACGLKLGPALSLNQNPIFEMASTLFKRDCPIYSNLL
jgi:hypothetical protein